MAIRDALENRRFPQVAGVVLAVLLAASGSSVVAAQSSGSAPAPKPDAAAQARPQTPGKDSDTAVKPASDPKVASTSDPGAAKPATEAPSTPVKLTPKEQLAADTALLYHLANELKAEMDKSTKDTLSLSVIRKADQVERMARKVRAEMKMDLGN